MHILQVKQERTQTNQSLQGMKQNQNQHENTHGNCNGWNNDDWNKQKKGWEEEVEHGEELKLMIILNWM